MPETDDARVLTPGAQHLLETAVAKQQEAKNDQLGLHHWLLALLERHGPMAESMASGFVAATVQAHLREQLKAGTAGRSLGQDEVVQGAQERARGRGKEQASERDLAAVILTADGYTLLEPAAPAARAATPAPDGAMSSPEPAAPEQPATTPESSLSGLSSLSGAAAYRPRARHPTPALEQFGRDLTREAVEGKLLPVVGREAEIELMIETLCRRTKRNPVLAGPAGSGKTAIVEGLARRIGAGEVPEFLRGSRLLALQPSSLVAGAGIVGELDKRMQAVIAEASQDGVILFIDEIHSIVGAGGREGSGDVASQLKPALARGEMACIAATTDDEYRRIIEPDAALERRFQPIRVQEMTPEQTLQVLASLRGELTRLRGVEVPDAVLSWLVDFAAQFLRNRTFPDKAVDLLEQCVAYAVTHDKKELSATDAESVARRMVGMPLSAAEQLQALERQLADHAVMRDEDARLLLNRLAVTMRGLDLRSARPNAVVLLAGEAAATSEALAEVVAESLFGARERVVTIDFGRMVQPHDVSLLVGAPPGYVGYSDALPLHRVAQMPWCVLRCENVHECHPQVGEVLVQALSDGFITESRGKRIFLSDLVVLLSADVRPARQRVVGFRKPGEEAAEDQRESLSRELGQQLVAECDVICTRAPEAGAGQRRWLEKSLLADLAGRYRRQELYLQWDKSLVDWLVAQQGDDANHRDWERLVDESLSPLLIPYLAGSGVKEMRSLVIKYENGSIRVESVKIDAG